MVDETVIKGIEMLGSSKGDQKDISDRKIVTALELPRANKEDQALVFRTLSGHMGYLIASMSKLGDIFSIIEMKMK